MGVTFVQLLVNVTRGMYGYIAVMIWKSNIGVQGVSLMGLWIAFGGEMCTLTLATIWGKLLSKTLSSMVSGSERGYGRVVIMAACHLDVSSLVLGTGVRVLAVVCATMGAFACNIFGSVVDLIWVVSIEFVTNKSLSLRCS